VTAATVTLIQDEAVLERRLRFSSNLKKFVKEFF
jgi:hypothetical protein